MSRWEWEDLFFKVFISGILIAIFGVLAAGAFDGYGSYRAQSAKVACAEKQMSSYRYSFSDSVVCIPYPNRQDTLTVQK